ncbi:mucin-binding protein, partial [Limosilactobacillus kribbianus]|uniref:mucin-binding protein n=1 Tax=Limosilactobacillus kribbianus TaxID=2982695 RepID=UPI003F657113
MTAVNNPEDELPYSATASFITDESSVSDQAGLNIHYINYDTGLPISNEEAVQTTYADPSTKQTITLPATSEFSHYHLVNSLKQSGNVITLNNGRTITLGANDQALALADGTKSIDVTYPSQQSQIGNIYIFYQGDAEKGSVVLLDADTKDPKGVNGYKVLETKATNDGHYGSAFTFPEGQDPETIVRYYVYGAHYLYDPNDPLNKAANAYQFNKTYTYTTGDNHNAGNTYYIYLKHTTQPLTATVKRTVKYIYGDTGKTAAADSVQTLTFTGNHDLVTDKDSWDTPKDDSFAAVTSPTIDGYTASEATVPAMGNITHETPNETEVVFYTKAPAKESAHVVYLDQDNHNAVLAQSAELSGNDGELINYSTKDQLATLEKQGYVLVNDGFPAGMATFDNNPKVEQVFQVILKHGTKTITQATQKGTQTVHYVGAGEQTPKDSTTSVEFNHTVVVDQTNNQVIKDNGWQPAEQTYQVIGTPAVTGYVPDAYYVGGDTVNATSPNRKYTVTYRQVKDPMTQDQNAEIRYLDQDNHNEEITNSGKLTGKPNTRINYSTAQTIKQLRDQGYILVNNDFDFEGQPQYFDANDQSDQVFIVTLKHNDSPVNPQHPNKEVDPSQYQKQVKATIHYAGAGDQTPADNVQTATWSRTLTWDPVTKQVVHGQYDTDWTPSKTNYDSVATPTIEGYVPDKSYVASQPVTMNDIETTVNYQKAPASQGSQTSQGSESQGSQTSQGSESQGSQTSQGSQSQGSQTSQGSESQGSQTSQGSQSQGSQTSQGSKSQGSETSQGSESQGSQTSQGSESQGSQTSQGSESQGSQTSQGSQSQGSQTSQGSQSQGSQTSQGSQSQGSETSQGSESQGSQASQGSESQGSETSQGSQSQGSQTSQGSESQGSQTSQGSQSQSSQTSQGSQSQSSQTSQGSQSQGSQTSQGSESQGSQTSQGSESQGSQTSQGSQSQGSQTSQGSESQGSETSQGSESQGSQTSQGSESQGSQTSQGSQSQGSETSQGSQSQGSQTSQGSESQGSQTSQGSQSQSSQTSQGSESQGSQTSQGSQSQGSQTSQGSQSQGSQTSQGSESQGSQTSQGSQSQSSQTSQGSQSQSSQTSQGSQSQGSQTSQGSQIQGSETSQSSQSQGSQTSQGSESQGSQTSQGSESQGSETSQGSESQGSQTSQGSQSQGSQTSQGSQSQGSQTSQGSQSQGSETSQGSQSQGSQTSQGSQSQGSQTSQGSQSQGSQTSQGSQSQGSQTSQGSQSQGSQTSQGSESQGSQTSQGSQSQGSETSQGSESQGSETSQESQGSETSQGSESQGSQTSQGSESQGNQTSQGSQSQGSQTSQGSETSQGSQSQGSQTSQGSQSQGSQTSQGSQSQGSQTSQVSESQGSQTSQGSQSQGSQTGQGSQSQGSQTSQGSESQGSQSSQTPTTDTEKVTITYVDPDGSPITTDTVTGKSGQPINYDQTKTITELKNKGYDVTNITNPTTGQNFDNNPSVDQTYTVTVKHGTAQLGPNDQHEPGTPINPNDPNGPKWPAKDTYSKDYTYTVHFVGPNGETLTGDNVQTSTWTRTVTVDKVTGKVISGTDWTPSQKKYSDVQVPVVDGYYTTQKTITGQPTVQKNISTTVSYQKLGQIVPVDQNGKQIGTGQTYQNDPNDPTKIAENQTVPSVDGYTPTNSTVTPIDPGANTTVIYTKNGNNGSTTNGGNTASTGQNSNSGQSTNSTTNGSSTTNDDQNANGNTSSNQNTTAEQGTSNGNVTGNGTYSGNTAGNGQLSTGTTGQIGNGGGYAGTVANGLQGQA